MAVDYEFPAMLRKIKDRQWALADIDWDAAGAELITERQRPGLKKFMADLVWIENIGARGFSALAKKADDDTLKEIYRYFHAEEQRHANAELALMHRWGMVDEGEWPEPNINVRLAIEWLDRYSDGLSLQILGTIIPILEVALDGALVKFLLDEVADPVCHQVFEKINSDESRHLAVDFQALDRLGHAPMRKLLVRTAGAVLNPAVLLGALMAIPLINKIRDSIVEMGLPEQQLYNAIKRFRKVGERGEGTRRLVPYQVVKVASTWVVNRDHPYHHVADFMVRMSDRIPRKFLNPKPTWATELTYQPISETVHKQGQ